MNAAAQHVLEKLSAFEPMSHVEYADIAGLKLTSAFARLCKLHESKIIHIARWSQKVSRGTPCPHYAIGRAPDAIYPKPITNREKLRRNRQKIKNEGGQRLENMLAKRRAEHLARKTTDPAYAQRRKEESRRYREKRARQKIPDVWLLDPLLAAIMAPRSLSEARC